MIKVMESPNKKGERDCVEDKDKGGDKQKTRLVLLENMRNDILARYRIVRLSE